MDTETSQTLGQRVRFARHARGWSLGQLAARCGLHPQVLGRIERGLTRAPRMTTISTLARALNIEPSWLLSGDPDAPGEPKPHIPSCTIPSTSQSLLRDPRASANGSRQSREPLPSSGMMPS
jgi:transcriptional regulator with XRE-family HTH domain